MNLFLCYTPLQLVIARRIIAVAKLPATQVEVLYIRKCDNNFARNALSWLSQIFSQSFMMLISLNEYTG